MVVHVALRSKATGKYLRLDGVNFTQPKDGGGGTVTPLDYRATQETFRLVENADGTVSFKSIVFSNIFLRMDGSAVTAGQNLAGGGGVVNAQFGAGPYEKFKIVKTNDTTAFAAIESANFPGRFMRMDATKVNVQGVREEWEILVVEVLA